MSASLVLSAFCVKYINPFTVVAATMTVALTATAAEASVPAAVARTTVLGTPITPNNPEAVAPTPFIIFVYVVLSLQIEIS